MRRFWREVAAAPAEGGWEVRLDARPVRTPARAALLLPAEILAEAVANEWRAVGETVDPRAMPLTGLANAAIDRVTPDPAAFAAGLAAYAGNDLLCYRAEGPASLVAREAEAWDPPLAWARARYDVALQVTTGVVHVPQSATALARLREATAARSAFALAGLSPLVTVSASLVLALAVAEGALGAAEAFAAATVDEAYQAEWWGEDELAVQAREARRADFLAGARFLELLAEANGGEQPSCRP